MVCGANWNQLVIMVLRLTGGLDSIPEPGPEQKSETSGQGDTEDNENPSGIPARAGYGSRHEAESFEMADGAWFALCVCPANDG